MQQQNNSGNKSNRYKYSNDSSDKRQNRQLSRNLYALIGQSSFDMMPYRSKFQLNSIGSSKSRQSRDSDLLNRLAKQSSKASSKSLNRNVSFQYIHQTQHNTSQQVQKQQHKSQLNSQKSNSNMSQSQKSLGKNPKQNKKQIKFIQTQKMVPKIHNCVCSVAGECLGYNCNCFLSPYPCAPDCCQNCLTLKSSLPLKFTNVCSCKKTRCLKLYCECLAKGLYCNVLCQCCLCENHQHSVSRIESIHNYQMYKGCSCQKSHCKKKYCDCYAQGLKCTNKCVCIDCHNFIQIKGNIMKDQSQQHYQSKNNTQMMDQEYQKEEEMQFQQIDFFRGNKKK